MPRTSQSHPIAVAFISPSAHSWPGRLGLTFAPGKKADSLYGEPWDRDLSTDLNRLRKAFGVDLLCPLLEEAEFTALGIPTLREEAIAFGMRVHHLPIPDTRAPDDQTIYSRMPSNTPKGGELPRNLRTHPFEPLLLKWRVTSELPSQSPNST